MKPGKRNQEKLEDLKHSHKDLDQAEGGGLKASEADQVRGGLGKKVSGNSPTASSPK